LLNEKQKPALQLLSHGIDVPETPYLTTSGPVNFLFATLMFLGPYELSGGPENFESVSILLYIIIYQGLLHLKSYLDKCCGLRARNKQSIEIPLSVVQYLDLSAPQGHQKSDIHINAAIVLFTIG